LGAVVARPIGAAAPEHKDTQERSASRRRVEKPQTVCCLGPLKLRLVEQPTVRSAHFIPRA
jgi:hypothetical protein